MLTYMEHNGDGALYRGLSINARSQLKHYVWYVAISDKEHT